MPGFDKTGPMGFGPRTGRCLGPCGMGLARGRGLGRYFGRQDLQDYTKSLEEELALAKEELQKLQQDQK